MSMAIDIKTETLLSPEQAAKMLPPGRNGAPVHFGTIIKAIRYGTDGHKLDGLRFGSRWMTSVEALQRWCEALASGPAKGQQTRTASGRRKAIERAERELSELGV
jgi:hypothetical protein